jgi:DNA-binding FrmR family transcriptional regulator
MMRKRTPGPDCACGCPPLEAAPGANRKTVTVDPALKEANLARLRRIEGQVRGIHKMIEEDRYCADVLGQLSAVYEALRGVSRELMRHHLRHCATRAIKAGPQEAETMYNELMELIYKSAR